MTAETTFDATSDTLANLMNEVAAGRLQLPDFQRGWVWDDEHIAAVITSVARSFPIGAVMTLQTGGEVRFKARAVEGVSFKGEPPQPDRLLLDGQQRLTSMYQALKLKHAIRTRDGKRRYMDVFYYVDITKALGSAEEREEAVFSVPAAKRLTADFGRQVLLDLTTPEQEYAAMMFPLNQTFSCDDWFDGFREFWDKDREKRDLLRPFRREFIDTFKTYAVPVIQLRRTASKEAVCRVFEKVNTGGVALTAFELLTATYAADGFNLREDWLGEPRATPAVPGRKARMTEAGKVLEAIEATDFLQAVSLLYTAAGKVRTEAGQGGKGVPSAISCTRQSILDLPLAGYRDHADRAEEGFKRARQFLWREMVFSGYDLPYRTQLVPLAAILVSLGDRWNDAAVRARVRNWFWCGQWLSTGCSRVTSSRCDSRSISSASAPRSAAAGPPCRWLWITACTPSSGSVLLASSTSRSKPRSGSNVPSGSANSRRRCATSRAAMPVPIATSCTAPSTRQARSVRRRAPRPASSSCWQSVTRRCSSPCSMAGRVKIGSRRSRTTTKPAGSRTGCTGRVRLPLTPSSAFSSP
jgi:hypothetical protein